MIVIHWISWLCLLSFIAPVIWILWIKNRSAITPWIRRVQHPERWILSTHLPKTATPENLRQALRNVVTESKNSGWNASCAFKKRDPATGEWTVGLVSSTQPLDTVVPDSYAYRKIEPCRVLRLSCPPDEQNTHIKADLKNWAEKNGTRYLPAAISLSAQSFQCWEWLVDDTSQPPKPSLLARIGERVFEIRDIILYPAIITIIALLLCGTGNIWLIGIGVFTIILMSGAHKFVFMYQREDVTQEEHLQNY